MGESTAFNRFHDWDSKGRGGSEDSELNTIHQNTSIRHYAGNIYVGFLIVVRIDFGKASLNYSTSYSTNSSAIHQITNV
ncbi:unnamed protein product [Rhizophagus irregularis]|nr:unnamed protein product [Rhizophagus irregularis]